MTGKRVGFVTQAQYSSLVRSIQFELIFLLEMEYIGGLFKGLFCCIFYHSGNACTSGDAADYKSNSQKKRTVSFGYIRLITKCLSACLIRIAIQYALLKYS